MMSFLECFQIFLHRNGIDKPESNNNSEKGKKASESQDGVKRKKPKLRVKDTETQSENSQDEIEGSNTLETRLVNYIKSNKDLYLHILQYKPVNVGILHDELKQNGIKCSQKVLTTFLDKQGCSFISPKPDQNKSGSRHRKYKGKTASQHSQESQQSQSQEKRRKN